MAAKHIRSHLRMKLPFTLAIDSDGAVQPARVESEPYRAAVETQGSDGAMQGFAASGHDGAGID